MASASLSQHVFMRLRSGGMKWLAAAIYYRIFPPRVSCRHHALDAAADRCGLEIGGPSRVFTRGAILPVYPRARRIDNVNFSPRTTWETDLRDGGEFRFDGARPAGRQFIRNATDLSGIPDAAYDFVISSHCLEHVANPLLALTEWRRVTRDGSRLLLILPDPLHTFDHRRPVTTLDHLRSDFMRNVDEGDETHFTEALALHDLRRDPAAGSAADFAARLRRNAENRCLHHHVFDPKLIATMLAETGWSVIQVETVRPLHLVALAWNPKAG